MDEMSSSPPDDGTRPKNKMDRLVKQYGLTDTADEIECAWTATGDEHRSLRELADQFNRELLECRLAEVGQQTLKGEAETLYGLLTGDDVSDGDRIRARRRLEQQGIDVRTLLDEFVSYQTVRRYLKNHRETSYTPEEVDRVEKANDDLQQLRGRVEAVATGKLEDLSKGQDLILGDFGVSVEIRIYCEDCETQYPASELLERGSCGCE